MDSHNALKKERDHVVNIDDAGVTGCEEDTNDGPVSSSNNYNKGAKRMSAKLKSGALSFDGATKGECSVNHNNLGDSNSELLIDNNNKNSGGEDSPLLEKKHVKEKSKTSSKKASKPPRPPKGPSLYTTDLILLREMSELAMKKRARIEHMKALKRKRALKSPSSSSSSKSCVPAMVVTLLFCLVIVFQGICSRNNTTKNYEGSPEPAAAAENELISVQFYNTQSPSDNSGPSSMSENFIENGPGSESRSPG